MVFVEMLFVLPRAQVPLWVAVGAVCTELPEYVLGIHPVERALVALGSLWFALAPALVFELAGRPTASLGAATVVFLVAALAARFGLDFGISALREWAALGVRPAQLADGLAWVLAIDLVLTPVGLVTAIAARHGEAALLLPLPLLFVIGLSTRERQ
jgi:hypothetical protein